MKDDTRLVLKSTAILFGHHGKPAIAALYAMTVLTWWIGGTMLGMSHGYAVGMLVIATHLAWQVVQFNTERPVANYGLFLANILTAALLVAAVLVGAW